jgi:uncharacterized membrane protein
MAQAGQTHRQQAGPKGKSQSLNGADSHRKSGARKSAPPRQSSAASRSTNGSTPGSRHSGHGASNGRRTPASSNGHNSRKSSGTTTKRRTSSGTGPKRRTRSGTASNSRTSQRKSQQEPPRQSQQKRSQQSSRPARSRQSKQARSKQPSLGIPTPDPRWGLVPLTTAWIGAAGWAILRRRRRKTGLARIMDYPSARAALGRELGDATDLAQAAGRSAGRLLRARAKDTQDAAHVAGRSTRRLLRAGAKETHTAAQAAGRNTGRFLRSEANDAARSAGKGTKRFLKRGAKEIRRAIPERPQPSQAARLGQQLASHRQQLASHGQELTSQGQRLASEVPSRAQDAWPLALALLPGAAYSAARLRASHRLPIQCSVDVAVPIEVVYDEWTALEFLPEGGHCVTDIERTDDGQLSGKIDGGLRSIDWEAEILDERDCESFAWRSHEGSDCAGLITFHQLAERLTRLELQLDVLPVRSWEAIALSLDRADRRAEAQLRRFKARLETMSPDAYKDSQETDETDQNEKEE